MIAVLTGDIINSQQTRPESWLKVLKEELALLGKTPRQWEVYRGDSFQAEISQPPEALQAAILLKAAVKSVKGADVRIAIGIGDKSYAAGTVTESNGSAFVHSGELLEELKKLKLTLAVHSGNESWDQEMNLYLKLALVFMDSWSVPAAATIRAALKQPDKSQEALGRQLGIKQNAVSTRLKRACYDEVVELLEMYRLKTEALL